jgi:hypothetical protein
VTNDFPSFTETMSPLDSNPPPSSPTFSVAPEAVSIFT